MRNKAVLPDPTGPPTPIRKICLFLLIVHFFFKLNVFVMFFVTSFI